MYKILIKYTSSSQKVFWQSYMTKNEEGEIVEFSTDDIDILKEEVKQIDGECGHDNVRIIKDVTYSVRIDIAESVDLENAEIATSEDVENVFNTAFNKVFGGE